MFYSTPRIYRLFQHLGIQRKPTANIKEGKA